MKSNPLGRDELTVTTPLFQTVFIVLMGLMPESVLFGVFTTEAKAQEAIKQKDPHNGYHCHIKEVTLNLWIENGMYV